MTGTLKVKDGGTGTTTIGFTQPIKIVNTYNCENDKIVLFDFFYGFFVAIVIVGLASIRLKP